MLASDWRVPDTRPDPIILSYTRSVPDIFSESSGISGIGYYKRVGFSMRPISFFNAFFIKMMPIFKMSPNFWPVPLWNCICGIFCTSIWTIHNIWNFKTINPKNSTEWKSKKSQKYFLIYGIHHFFFGKSGDFFFVRYCMVLSCICTNPEWLVWHWYWAKQKIEKSGWSDQGCWALF